MKRVALRVVMATALVGLGWVAGQGAQTSKADFELEVSSPNGSTTITCRRGCGLQFIRYTPNKAEAQPSFTYDCQSPNGRCGGVVQGWLLK
jgi:hypothetical protein